MHPGAIGRRVELTADLTRVRVACEGRTVADHPRLWARHQTISDPEHVRAARGMRRDRWQAPRPGAQADVEVRCLADYDAELGVDLDTEPECGAA